MNQAPTQSDSLVRQAAELTEAILSMPAVATPDWADRAARGLAGLEGVRAACVLIWILGRGGSPAALEGAGVWVGAGGGSDGTTTLRVRSRIERELRLGSLEPARAAGERPRIGRAPATEGEGRGRLWQGLDAEEVVSCAIAVDAGADGRVIECLVAVGRVGPGAADGVESVLRAAAPALGRRAALALAPGEDGQSPWLTDREAIVLEHLVSGLSVRLIAEQIGRSPHTVHDHVKNLHRKLGASTRGELVARALGHAARFGTHPREDAAPTRPSAQLEPKGHAAHHSRTGVS